MGLDLPSVQLLCCAKNMGVDFSDTLTIGRQVIVKQREFPDAFSTAGISEVEISKIRDGDYGESIFHLLGAKRVGSLDASEYEGATYIYDLNHPISGRVGQKFSVVFDGGSLEHVFNLPQALKNCMEMVNDGGHFIQITAANNFMGHGFWQLSPEALYRVFSEENGFKTKAVFLTEVSRTFFEGRHRTMPWYLVSDPAIYGSRVELVNRRRTFICTIAQRLADKEIFAKWPQQSDYLPKWDGARATRRLPQQTILSYLRRIAPRPIKRLARATIELFRDEFDQPCYRRISALDLMHGRLGEPAIASRSSVALEGVR